MADLGAAGNLVRNLLLLSNQVDWPLPTNRLDTILQQYLPNTDLSQWLNIEYRLRFWDRFYNVDLSDNIDLEKFQKRKITSDPVIYLNHSAFYQPTEYHQLASQVSTLYVAPQTDFGLRWQIRSYCEKKTVEKLHNFSFENNIDEQRSQYCATHGVESYYKLNIKNFAEIVKHRQANFGIPDISLELLLSGPAEEIIDCFYTCLSIRIDVNQAKQVLEKWRQCHWPMNETDNWKYYDNDAQH